jgi:hypothetical protein
LGDDNDHALSSKRRDFILHTPARAPQRRIGRATTLPGVDDLIPNLVTMSLYVTHGESFRNEIANCHESREQTGVEIDYAMLCSLGSEQRRAARRHNREKLAGLPMIMHLSQHLEHRGGCGRAGKKIVIAALNLDQKRSISSRQKNGLVHKAHHKDLHGEFDSRNNL